MSLRLDSFVGQPRDSKREQELLRALRQEPESVRVGFIQDVLAQDVALGLYLAKRCSLARSSLLSILDEGLKRASASSIELWLEAVIEGLGFSRVASVLAARVSDDPLAVIRARYHLPKWLPANHAASEQALRELDHALEAAASARPELRRVMHPNRNPDGTYSALPYDDVQAALGQPKGT